MWRRCGPTLRGWRPRRTWRPRKPTLRPGRPNVLAADVTDLKVALTDKPGKLYMWGILTALLTAYACGLAALAILK